MAEADKGDAVFQMNEENHKNQSCNFNFRALDISREGHTL